MVERLHSVPLTDFNTQSAGAELSVAAGGINMNAVNIVINTADWHRSRPCVYNNILWCLNSNGSRVYKFNISDLSFIEFITLTWGGVNVANQVFSVYVTGTYIYSLCYWTQPKAIAVFNHDGTFVAEYINNVNPPANNESWGSRDMCGFGGHLYLATWAEGIKKFDLVGTYVAKTIGVLGGQHCRGADDGMLYMTQAGNRITSRIDPSDMSVLDSVDTLSFAENLTAVGGINAVDEDRIFKTGVRCIGIEDMSGDYVNTIGGFGMDVITDYTGTRKPGVFNQIWEGAVLDADYLYITDRACAGLAGGHALHKIYVKENRTVQTFAPVITGEADLKVKTGLVGPSYLRLAVQEDADGGEITYYRSPDGAAWTEVTRASGFDLSGHNVADPLYLKIQLDNLRAKVGSPVIYGIDIVAEGNPPDDYADILGVIPDDDEVIEAVLHE